MIRPDSICWRTLRPSDIPFAHGLNCIAGWNQTEADWRNYLEFEPDGCLGVEVDGRLAGTATALRYGDTLGWIGMVLVHPTHRRLGLGTELLRRALGYLVDHGIPVIKLDATPIGRKVYVPLGFRDEGDVIRFEGIARPGGGASPVAPFSSLPFSAIADFDAAAFGVARRAILTALSRARPALCFAEADERGIGGYLIAREGREAVQLGPWVARDPATAERLLQALFRAVHGRRIFLDLAASNPSGIDLLVRHGFIVQRSFTRMFLGAPGPVGRPELVYGTSGAEKG